MSTSCYSFKNSLPKGEKGEKVLDNYYGEWYIIQPVSPQTQRYGIDRAWTHKESGFRYSVEYKSDWTAATSGNIFVETVSVDTTDTPGWAYSSCAQLLVYFIPPLSKAYIMSMLSFKFKVKEWVELYPEKIIENEGYNTIGVAVPIEVFERECWKIDRDIVE